MSDVVLMLDISLLLRRQYKHSKLPVSAGFVSHACRISQLHTVNMRISPKAGRVNSVRVWLTARYTSSIGWYAVTFGIPGHLLFVLEGNERNVHLLLIRTQDSPIRIIQLKTTSRTGSGYSGQRPGSLGMGVRSERISIQSRWIERVSSDGSRGPAVPLGALCQPHRPQDHTVAG